MACVLMGATCLPACCRMNDEPAQSCWSVWWACMSNVLDHLPHTDAVAQLIGFLCSIAGYYQRWVLYVCLVPICVGWCQQPGP